MDPTARIRNQLMQQLESLRASGVQTIPKGSGKIVPSSEPSSVNFSSSSAAGANSAAIPSKVAESPEPMKVNSEARPVDQVDLQVDSYGPLVSAGEREPALQLIQSEVANCRSCAELCASRKQTVFGVGNPNARLCFVGEGPGADEDRLGEPFVGAAGQLLDKIIGACKMSRNDIYILNTVKCRPPGNRNPQEDELANCWPFAIRQLEVIQPEFICCLGSVAAKTVLNTKSSISKLRGQFHSFRGSRVVVTYHPAYLLRTPTAKKHTWNDMKMLMAEMGVEL